MEVIAALRWLGGTYLLLGMALAVDWVLPASVPRLVVICLGVVVLAAWRWVVVDLFGWKEAS